MTSAGTSSAPAPPEINEVLLVERMHWSWQAYISMPEDVLQQYIFALNSIDAARAAATPSAGTPAGMTVYALNDTDP